MTIKVKENRTYRRDGQHSFFADHIAVATGGQGSYDARERLAQHAVEVAAEIELGSREGQRAERQLRNINRKETRAAMTTVAGAGGEFVSPEWFNAEFGIFPNFPATFLNECVQLEDPGYGFTMSVPNVQSASTVSQQSTQNTAISNGSPTTGKNNQAALTNVSGQVIASQQLVDRAQGNFDIVVGRQLQSDLCAKADALAIAQALTGVTPITSSTFATKTFWANFAQAASQIEGVDGSALLATHAFMTPTQYRWLTSQSDSNGRPLLLPMPLPAPDRDSDPYFTDLGYTGERILDVPVYRDGNIPAVTTNTQMIVANMDSVFAQVSEPALRVIPNAGGTQSAASLSVIIQLYSYVGVLVRVAGAVQTITGASYPLSPAWPTT